MEPNDLDLTNLLDSIRRQRTELEQQLTEPSHSEEETTRLLQRIDELKDRISRTVPVPPPQPRSGT